MRTAGRHGNASGQNRGVLRSAVSAFFSLPLLKVWMELSSAARPGGGGGEEEESGAVGGGGAGGGAGGGVDPGATERKER